MIQILIKQNYNKWTRLDWWHRTQLVLLTIILLAYLVSQSQSWFKLNQNNIVSGSIIFLSLFAALLGLQGGFVLKYAIPRQKSLYIFHTLPLSTNELVQIIFYYYHLFALIPFLLLLVISTGIFPLHPVLGLIVFVTGLLLDLLIFRIVLFILFRTISLRRSVPRGAIQLEDIYTFNTHMYQAKKVKPKAGRIPATLFGQLMLKELVGLWRNPRYRRLKIFTYLTYILILITLYFSGISNSDMWMMFFSAAVFWAHYNVYFNSKYVVPDPEWYFRTLPLKFNKVWFSKFLAEFIYIAVLLLSQWTFLMLAGVEFWIQLNWIGALGLFAAIILSVVINFQILFFDNPRLAGFAYHFTILFILIMSINFRLVGPLTAIFLLTFYFIKTLRFYKS